MNNSKNYKDLKTLEFWKSGDFFNKSVQQNTDKQYIFFDGPPFANGLPHYGHLLTGFVKDVFARYHTSLGEKCERKFGWDCHGLPAEMESEKELNVSGRLAIKEFNGKFGDKQITNERGETLEGIAAFNEHCKSSVMKYADQWEDYVTRQGRWVDFKDSYKTMDLDYMESVIGAFAKLNDRGLIYESTRVMPYSWKCETPLSNFETKMDNSYREKESKTCTVKFKLTPEAKSELAKKLNKNLESIDNIYILAWTTTPWTLPSNLALAVGADIDYTIIKSGDDAYIIAKSLVSKYQKELLSADASVQNISQALKSLGLDFDCEVKLLDDKFTADFCVKSNNLAIELKADQKAKLEFDTKTKPQLKKQGFNSICLTYEQAASVDLSVKIKNLIVMESSEIEYKIEKNSEKCLEIRREVFIEEQGVAADLELEFENDQADMITHFGFYHKGEMVGAMRSRVTKNGTKLERICTLKTHRGLGVAKACLTEIIQTIGGEIYLNSQSQAAGFYQKLGFVESGDEFVEADIPHVKMIFLKNSPDLFSGSILENLHYTPLFPYFKDTANAFRVLVGDFVSTVDGTGIVHMAPGFGEDDFNLCRKNNIPVLCPIDDGAKFNHQKIIDLEYTLGDRKETLSLIDRCVLEQSQNDRGVKNYDGVNEDVIKYLKSQNLWLKTEQYLHNYPHCWRTDTPLIYKAVGSWYVNVAGDGQGDAKIPTQAGEKTIKDRMIELNRGKVYEFETANLYTKKISLQDLDAIAKMRADSEVMKFYPETETREQVENFILELTKNEAEKDLVYYSIFEKNTDKFVGIGGFKDFFGQCEIGITIDKPFWGRGYGSEFAAKLFEFSPKNELLAITLENNTAAENLLKKQGFEFKEKSYFEAFNIYTNFWTKKIDQPFAGIKWIPDHIRDGQFGKWLEGSRDWSISRNRFFGCPIPVWKSSYDHKTKFFSSIKEMEDEFKIFYLYEYYVLQHIEPNEYANYTWKYIQEDGSFKITDLHRPYIDELRAPILTDNSIKQIIADCGDALQTGNKNMEINNIVSDIINYFRQFHSNELVRSGLFYCGNTRIEENGDEEVRASSSFDDFVFYERIEDVFDCWFESGSMPFASIGFKDFDSKPSNFPADFIVEYVAQTRGWFYTLMILSTALFDSAPFKNCICHGVILDSNGEKLSKRLRNYPDPMMMFDQYGSDAMRWFLLASPVMRGGELYMDQTGDQIRDASRGVIVPFLNAVNFLTTYAKIDNIKFKNVIDQTVDGDMNNYIISVAIDTVEKIRQSMDAYDTPSACAAFEIFIDSLNNWYIRRNKDVFWESGISPTKQQAFDVLYSVIINVSKAVSSLLPFTTESIFGELEG